MARPSGRDIRQLAIDETRLAVQARGVTGFSYGDLARRLGIKAPSLHHHFPQKQDLIAQTASVHRTRFDEQVAAITPETTVERLIAYGELFLSPAHDGLLCFCGAAVAGWDDLEAEARAEISSFFDEQVAWVATELHDGQQRGEVAAALDVDAVAFAYIAALEGALLLARTRGAANPAAVAASLVALLVVG